MEEELSSRKKTARIVFWLLIKGVKKPKLIVVEV